MVGSRRVVLGSKCSFCCLFQCPVPLKCVIQAFITSGSNVYSPSGARTRHQLTVCFWITFKVLFLISKALNLTFTFTCLPSCENHKELDVPRPRLKNQSDIPSGFSKPLTPPSAEISKCRRCSSKKAYC